MDIPSSLLTEAALMNENPKYKIVQTALRKTNIKNISTSQNVLNKLPFKFNLTLPELVTATNQKRSGRCWLFAGLNVIRHVMIQKYKLPPDFELSQAYLFKYDKIEKCNTALEIIYDLAKNDKLDNSLEYNTLIYWTIHDGGSINQFSNLIKKYGVVPKDIYPDLAQVENTKMLNNLLNITIRKTAAIIHKNMIRTEFNTYKATILKECHRIITLCFGSTPHNFSWNLKESSANYTPISFYKKMVKPLFNIDHYICIVNDPRNDYNQLLSIEYLHNVLNNDDTDLKNKITNLYLNVDINTMKTAVFNTMTKYKTPVAFDANYSSFVLNKETVLDLEALIIEDMFDTQFVFDKKTNMNIGIYGSSHVMTFIGCQKEDTVFKRWKVENSHGTKTLYKGFLTMSDVFFDKCVFAALVHKNTLPAHLRKTFVSKKNIKWLPFWDIL